MRRDRAILAPLRFAAPLCALAVCTFGLGGCQAWQPVKYNPPEFAFGPRVVPPQGNPILVTSMDRDFVWEQVVDVVEESEPASGRLPARLRPGKSLPQVPLAPRGNASLPEVIPTPKGTSPKASHSGNSNDSN